MVSEKAQNLFGSQSLAAVVSRPPSNSLCLPPRPDMTHSYKKQISWVVRHGFESVMGDGALFLPFGLGIGCQGLWRWWDATVLVWTKVPTPKILIFYIKIKYQLAYWMTTVIRIIMVALFFGNMILQMFTLVQAGDFGQPDCIVAHSQKWVGISKKFNSGCYSLVKLYFRRKISILMLSYISYSTVKSTRLLWIDKSIGHIEYSRTELSLTLLQPKKL